MATTQIFTKCTICPFMSGAFKALDSDELGRIDKHRTEITYKKGELICKQGTFISNTIYIKSGLVKIFLEGNEKSTIISIEKKGYFIGIPSIFGEGVFHYNAEALTDVEVCQVDINVYREMIHKNARFASKILEIANEDIISSYNRITSLTQKQIHGRFAELILTLKNRIYEKNPFDLTITRKDMADIIHTSPESISRLMKEFREDKILNCDNHSVEIINEDKLKGICQHG